MAGAIRQVFEFATRATGSLDDIRDDIERTASAVDDLGNESDETSRQSGKAEKGLLNIGKAAKLALAGLVALAGVATAREALVSLYNSVVEVDTAMNQFEAQTGLGGDALAEYRDVAESIFKAGWGESFASVAQAMGQVRNITQASGDDLATLTEKALVMQSVFGKDINESVGTANTLMETFGITGGYAFDLITNGLQKTGDPTGNLLDTMNEFAPVFKDMGFGASEMLSILETGMGGGAKDAQVLGQAVTEFNKGLVDGSGQAAMYAMGLGDMNYNFVRGKASGEAMLKAALDGLRKIDDPLERARLGTQLFGEKWNEVGENALLAMDTAGEGLEDVIGATDRAGRAMQRGPRAAWERFTRTVKIGLTDALGPYIEQGLLVAIAALERLGQWVDGVGIPALSEFAGWIDQSGALDAVAASASTALAVMSKTGDWIEETGIPGFMEFAKWIKESTPIQFLGDKAGILADNLGKVRSYFEDGTVLDTMMGGFRTASDSAKTIVDSLVSIGSWAGSMALDAVLAGLDTASTSAGIIVDSLMQIGTWAGISGLTSTADGLFRASDSASTIADSMVEISKYSLATVLGNLDPNAVALVAVSIGFMAGKAVIAGIAELATQLLAMAGAAGGLMASVLPLLLIAGLVLALQTNFGGLSDSINQAGRGIRNGDMKMALDGILDSLTAIPMGIATWIGDQAGINVPEGLSSWKENLGMIEAIFLAIPGYIDSVVEKAKIPFEFPGFLDFKTVVSDVKSLLNEVLSLISQVNSALGGGSETATGWEGQILPEGFSETATWDVYDSTEWSPSKDTGGPYRAGQPYVIGRRAQPELFVPRESGTAYPAGSYPALAGGGDTYNFSGFTLYGVNDAARLLDRLEREARRRNRTLTTKGRTKR